MFLIVAIVIIVHVIISPLAINIKMNFASSECAIRSLVSLNLDKGTNDNPCIDFCGSDNKNDFPVDRS